MKQNIDWNFILALSALVISVLSPMCVALINNVHSRKMYAKTFFYERRAQIIEEYLASAENRAASVIDLKQNSSHWTDHYFEIHFYVEPSLWPNIDKFEDALSGRDVNCKSLLLDLVHALSKYPPRSKN